MENNQKQPKKQPKKHHSGYKNGPRNPQLHDSLIQPLTDYIYSQADMNEGVMEVYFRDKSKITKGWNSFFKVLDNKQLRDRELQATGSKDDESGKKSKDTYTAFCEAVEAFCHIEGDKKILEFSADKLIQSALWEGILKYFLYDLDSSNYGIDELYGKKGSYMVDKSTNEIMKRFPYHTNENKLTKIKGCLSKAHDERNKAAHSPRQNTVCEELEATIRGCFALSVFQYQLGKVWAGVHVLVKAGECNELNDGKVKIINEHAPVYNGRVEEPIRTFVFNDYGTGKAYLPVLSNNQDRYWNNTIETTVEVQLLVMGMETRKKALTVRKGEFRDDYNCEFDLGTKEEIEKQQIEEKPQKQEKSQTQQKPQERDKPKTEEKPPQEPTIIFDPSPGPDPKPTTGRDVTLNHYLETAVKWVKDRWKWCVAALLLIVAIGILPKLMGIGGGTSASATPPVIEGAWVMTVIDGHQVPVGEAGATIVRVSGRTDAYQAKITTNDGEQYVVDFTVNPEQLTVSSAQMGSGHIEQSSTKTKIIFDRWSLER